MGNTLRLFIVALLACSGAFAQSAETTFDLVSKAKKCTTNSVSGSIDCEYKVGKDLHFAIAAVGEADGAVTFYRVNMDGDYYASFGLKHQCVIVKTGAKPAKGVSPLALAFVSPKNGKVYRTWEDCRSGQ